ncbi:glycoside hydrolase family 6 protein [Streptomyces chryseus]|uniref:glycoside hydrolase family 6 protein n=1 Tax=Streptomyces chryseus TaxID=68186 RepID=UPI0019843CE6|nr:glycoside hydrolase family 6 protein [Streptomyces chryseus]GGX08060.1 glucanase [Streptomyces chryseus]
MRTTRPILRTALPLALTTGLASALLLGSPPALATEDPVDALTTSLYAPKANPQAYRQADELEGAKRSREAAGLRAMARTPHAVWLAGRTPDEVRKETRAVVRDAARRRATPTLVLYNVPGRDCSLYSAGGLRDTTEYRAWVGAVAEGIGAGRAVVVVEPDALALVPADCPGGAKDTKDAKDAKDTERVKATRTAARYAQVSEAVATLGTLPRTKVYVDAGHPAWHTVDSIVPRLVKGGVAHATGFSVNVSNYSTDDANAWYGRLVSSCLAYVDKGGKASACPTQKWRRADARRWLDRHVPLDPGRMKHFVTDTSRNGQGPWTPPDGKYRDAQDWCNPPARGLGARPTTRTGDPLNDANLWIKTPGESDGECLRGTMGPQDPERGRVDPKAGVWFPAQALELVRLANPAIMPPENRVPGRGRDV